MQSKDQAAVIAVNRFGLGARPGELQTAKKDPHRWLLAQMVNPKFDPSVGNLHMAYETLAASDKMKKKRKEMQAQGMEAEKGTYSPIKQFQRELLQDGLQHSLTTNHPFALRMFDFFSNHFSVTVVSNLMMVLAPLLEREAIAPHVFGRFEDMLLAVEQHPAMIVYLNNEQSFGPNSLIGKKRGGLNENLAREILELHTLGIDGGYDLNDIQQLAMAISGWSVSGRRAKDSYRGFVFRSKGHEPGKRNVLGVQYSQSGIKQGRAILRDLAAHPSTARFVSDKMARYFISDQPSVALVNAMQDAWLETDSDLEAVATAMLGHKDAWLAEQEKFKAPRDFVVSCLRACNVELESKSTRRIAKTLGDTLNSMGQAPFNAGSPAGYSSDNTAWSGSDALMKRINWVSQLTDRVKRDPIKIAQMTLGETVSEATRLSVTRAESRSQGLALLLLSPEFQRR